MSNGQVSLEYGVGARERAALCRIKAQTLLQEAEAKLPQVAEQYRALAAQWLALANHIEETVPLDQTLTDAGLGSDGAHFEDYELGLGNGGEES